MSFLLLLNATINTVRSHDIARFLCYNMHILEGRFRCTLNKYKEWTLLRAPFLHTPLLSLFSSPFARYTLPSIIIFLEHRRLFLSLPILCFYFHFFVYICSFDCLLCSSILVCCIILRRKTLTIYAKIKDKNALSNNKVTHTNG